MTKHVFSFIVLTLPLLLCFACVETHSREPNPKPKSEQDLEITLGGFLHNGPMDERLEGQCTPNLTRDLLECDIHNGLMK